MGSPFGGNSSSKQTQTTLTDEAAQAGGKLSTTGRDQAFTLGAGTQYSESGALQVTGKGAVANLGNVTAQAGSTLNLGVSTGELSDLIGKFTQASSEQADALAAIVAGQQSQIGDLAQNQQSGEQTTQDKTLVWLTAAAVAGLLLLAWRALR